MKRRRFLQQATAGSVALALPHAGWFASAPMIDHRLARPALLTLFADTQQVRAIGMAYREAFPDENDPILLSEAILTDLPADRIAMPTCLDRQIRDEFARGGTVRVNGWILAQTEARQSALFSFLYP